MIPTTHGAPEERLVPLVDLYPFNGETFRSGKDELPSDWRLHLSKNDREFIDSDWLLFWVDPSGDLKLFCKMWLATSPTAGKFLYGLVGRCRLLVFHNPQGYRKAPLTAYWSTRMNGSYDILKEGEFDG